MTVSAKEFKGFYVGVSAGYTQKKQTAYVSGIEQDGGTQYILDAQSDQKKGAVNYGLFGGYGQTLVNDIYVGGEIELNHDDASKDIIHNTTVRVNGVNSSVPFQFKAKYVRSPVFSLAPRLGIVFNGLGKKDMVFLKPSFEASKDYVQVSGSGRIEKSGKKIKVAFVPTVGWETKIDDHLMALISYGYNIGNKISFKDKDGDLTSVKYSAHVVKAGISYQF